MARMIDAEVKWEKGRYGSLCCSNCFFTFLKGQCVGYGYNRSNEEREFCMDSTDAVGDLIHFCPSCGERMGGETNDTT